MTVKVKQLRPGSWYIVVHWRGRRMARKVGDSKRAADHIAEEFIRELEFRGYAALEAFKARGAGSGLTVSTYADRWVAEVEKSGLRPSTVNSYKSNVLRHIKPWFGDMALADVSYARVKEFVADKLRETYARAPGENAPRRAYSRDAIRIMVATLRAMLEEAVREELIESNPAHGLGRFYSAARRLRDEPDPFSLADLHAVEAACSERWPEHHCFLLFQSRTGARVGEAIALQWPDVDLAAGTAMIRRTMPVHRQVGPPKSPSSTRTVDLSPELIAALRAQDGRQRAFWFGRGKDMPGWVFATPGGDAPEYSNFRKAFIRMQRRAGVRVRRPHDLRHTYASAQLAAGKPLAYVAAQLGHKSPQVTLSIYARWVPGTDPGRRDAMDREAATGRQRTQTGGLDENGRNP